MTDERAVVWMGGRTCDVCGEKELDELYDAKTRFGPWGTLCPDCFEAHGLGVGQGRGQHYRMDFHGRLLKVEG